MLKLQEHVHIKNYISIQTLSIFLMGCLFIVISIYGLGTPNMMVGGFGIFLLKAITNKDFSSKPLTSIMNITIYTLFIAILPYIVNLNVYTGLIINFIAIFLLLYMLVYSLKETIYIPFLLGYAFFLNSPATGKYFTLRIFGLIFIAVVAVIYQIVYYKLKGSESLACNNINKSFFLLSKLASDKKYNATTFDETIKSLEKHNLKWNSDILNNKKNSFYFTKDENIQLNLVSSIRTLKFRISDLSPEGKSILDDIIPLIANLRNFNRGSYKRYLLIEDFSYFNNKYKNNLSTELYEIKESLNIIFALLINFYDIRKGRIKVSNRSKLRDYIDLEKNLFKDFRRGSSRFTFAFRTALLISLSYFFITLFNIEMGKWIIYTIVSISQPYYDVTKQKAFQRLRGTIIGGVIFTILSIIFTTFDERLIIIFIAIYFVIAFTDYSKRITAATVMALTIVSTSQPHMILMTWDRLFFVFLGAIIVIIGSLIILPYSLTTEIYDLTELYSQICDKTLNKLFEIHSNKDTVQEIDNFILEANIIDGKISVNNSAYDIKVLNEFLMEGRLLLDNVHKIINRVFTYDQTLLSNKFERIEKLKEMKQDIDNIKDLDSFRIENISDKYFKNLSGKGELLIYKEVFDSLLANRRLIYLKQKMDESVKARNKKTFIQKLYNSKSI